MITYLKKFSSLPKHIQAKINDPETMKLISDLGTQYKLNLASTVMKIMVGEIKLEGLTAYLINELGLSLEAATNLDLRLRRGVFADVIDYILGADKGAKLVFSEADEAEVRQSHTKVSTSKFDDSVEENVEAIVAQSRINFPEQLTAGKFRQVLKTYIRGTRDKLATMEALTKAVELGGVALSRDAAERSLIIASNFLPKKSTSVTATKAKINVPEDLAATIATEAYDLTTSLREQGKLKNTSKKAIVKPSSVLDELMPPPPMVIETHPTAASDKRPVSVETKQAVKEIIKAKKVDKSSFRRISATVPPVDNIIKSDTGKARMDDIRYTARALSPVEEIREFTLLNFRRLDPDPIKGVEKIKEKMENLGKEKYTQKIAAIEAWHESPLNRLYLAVCRKSMEDSMALSLVLERELKRDKDFLRPEELSAIISLNKSLKF